MKNGIVKISSALVYALLLLMVSCQPQPEALPEVVEIAPLNSVDKVHKKILPGIRLGDGVPLQLDVAIRWNVTDLDLFSQQFADVAQFHNLILTPRALELTKKISNDFASVDSVFSTQRNSYINAVKASLLTGLGERGIEIKEIILADVGFPSSYTKVMEEASLKQRELERIRLQNVVDVEQSAANKLKAEAEAKVAIAQAEADGRIQKIKAKMEESRRKSELAKAETQTQVEKLKVAAEAEKRKLIANAELDKQQKLKDLEIERQRELDRLAIEKKRAMNENELVREARFAQICTENPTYATYVVNKQLASKVDVAFLPTSTDPNIFTNLIKTKLPLPGTRE